MTYKKFNTTIAVATSLISTVKDLSFTVDYYSDRADPEGHFRVLIVQEISGRETHKIMINWLFDRGWEVWSDRIDSWLRDDEGMLIYNDIRFEDSNKMMAYIYHMLKAYESKSA